MSTILAIIKLRANTKRLKFDYKFDPTFNAETQEQEPYLAFSIVNVSERAIILKNIIVERYLSTKEIEPKPQYCEQELEKLNHGEQYKYKLNISKTQLASLTFDLNQIKSLKGGGKYLTTNVYYPIKIRLKVLDTTGKMYMSEWIDVDKIQEQNIDSNIIKW